MIFYHRFLNDLRPFAPNEQEFKKLSFLLTLKRLQDHTDYRNWNPSAGRVQCFQEVLPLVHRFLQVNIFLRSYFDFFLSIFANLISN